MHFSSPLRSRSLSSVRHLPLSPTTPTCTSTGPALRHRRARHDNYDAHLTALCNNMELFTFGRGPGGEALQCRWIESQWPPSTPDSGWRPTSCSGFRTSARHARSHKRRPSSMGAHCVSGRSGMAARLLYPRRLLPEITAFHRLCGATATFRRTPTECDELRALLGQYAAVAAPTKNPLCSTPSRLSFMTFIVASSSELPSLRKTHTSWPPNRVARPGEGTPSFIEHTDKDGGGVAEFVEWLIPA